MEKAIIGRKVGMTQVFNNEGVVIPVTVIEAGPCTVVQVKTEDMISLNPIVKVQNYGYCIWGNRTLFPNIATKAHKDGDLAASSFLNIRNLISDVKKTVFRAARQMTFEQNSAILWVKFKSLVFGQICNLNPYTDNNELASILALYYMLLIII